MRKPNRQRTNNWDDNKQQKVNQEQQIFQKVNNNFKLLAKRPSNHVRIATTIKQQIKRPQTSKRLKKDYKELMELLDCNKMIIDSKERSIMTYKNMKCINSRNTEKFMYSPVLAEINQTQGNLSRKKYKKYDLREFNNYMNNKQVKEDSIQAFVEKNLFKSILDIQAFIPIQAKLHKKLNLFGELLEEQKHFHVEQVKKLIEKQRLKGTSLTKKFQIYIINHYLIENLMRRTFSDSEAALKLKEKYSDIYSLIKNEMIGQIIKEEKFRQILILMQEHQENSAKLPLKLNKQQRQQNVRRKPFQKFQMEKRSRNVSQMNTQRTIKGNKQNEITIQFQKFYQIAQEKLNDAQLELKFPSNRRNNFYSVIQLEKLYTS